MITKATREGYGEMLAELGAEYPNLVVLDADLAAATKTSVFQKHPQSKYCYKNFLSAQFGTY